MKFKTLPAAMLAAGVLAVSTAGAFSLKPNWMKGGESTVAAAAVNPQSANAAPAPVAPIATQGGLVPNYRAIVAQYGPAVVGVTVSGMHKVSLEEQQQQQAL